MELSLIKVGKRRYRRHQSTAGWREKRCRWAVKKINFDPPEI